MEAHRTCRKVSHWALETATALNSFSFSMVARSDTTSSVTPNTSQVRASLRDSFRKVLGEGCRWDGRVRCVLWEGSKAYPAKLCIFLTHEATTHTSRGRLGGCRRVTPTDATASNSSTVGIPSRLHWKLDRLSGSIPSGRLGCWLAIADEDVRWNSAFSSAEIAYAHANLGIRPKKPKQSAAERTLLLQHTRNMRDGAWSRERERMRPDGMHTASRPSGYACSANTYGPNVCTTRTRA